MHPSQGPPMVSVEAYTSLQSEMLGRLHGMQDSYQALYRELYETRRRQDVLIDFLNQMYHAMHTVTSGQSACIKLISDVRVS